MFNKKFIAFIIIFSLIIHSSLALAGYATLRLGDSGEEVRKMQQKLKSVGYNIKVDGHFGESTLREIKRFQKAHGLTMDGDAGNATLEKLYGEKAPNNYAPQISKTKNSLPDTINLPEASLRKGDSGEDVKYMQLALNNLNYGYKDKLGSFGSSTQAALKRFQHKHKLSADGVAGDTTLKLLYSKCGINTRGRVKSSKEIRNNNSSNQTIIKLERASIPSFSLKSGMEGNYVRDMQIALAQLGFYRGNYDGKYGLNTINAVKSFQAKYKLSKDGIAGIATLKQIYKKAGIKYTVENNSSNIQNGGNNQKKIYIRNATIPLQSLRSGQKNTFVKEMQLALMQLGYNVGKADGNFGSGTKSALISFQRDNRLSRDGVAGKSTLTKLYNKANVKINYEKNNPNDNENSNDQNNNNNSSAGNSGPTQSIAAPNIGSVKLMSWYNEVKPKLRYGSKVNIYDPKTNSGYELTVLSTGRHLDAEPTTVQDTDNLNRIFGGRPTWTPKIVYAQLPNGEWSLASTHNFPHLSGNIKDNNFNGHLCVHFLRDMEETIQKDPNYGVLNQNNLRSAWKRMTGETIK